MAVLAGLAAVALPEVTGAKTKTRVYKSAAVHPIPEQTAGAGEGVTYSTIQVKKPARTRHRIARIRKASVRVRADHTFAGDLGIYLIEPSYSRRIDLSTYHGGNADNYGAGPNNCAGTFTVFDDAAPLSIADPGATPPFAGAFRPEDAISDLLRGIPPDGQWWLVINDRSTADTGALGCWELQITYKVYKF